MRTYAQKFSYIDALRGIAILLVITGHVFLWIEPDSTLFCAFIPPVGRGVQLFYIISGLTLCFSIRNRTYREVRPFLNFFLRRFFRIAPLFYLAILFYAILSPEEIEEWKVISTFFFLHGIHPETINNVVLGGWSIAVQMAFYLCLPFLYRVLNDASKAILGFFISIPINLIVSKALYTFLLPEFAGDKERVLHEYFFYWFPSQLPVFILGILLFHIISESNETDKKWAVPTLVVAGYLFASFMKCNYVRLIPHHVLFGIGFAFLTYSLSMRPIPVFVNKITIWIGRLSYSIYLVHLAVISFYRMHFPDGILLGGVSGFFISLLAVIATAVLLSILTYNFIEKPGIQLGKYVIKKLDSRKISRHNLIKASS